jgi:hypothetical protein
MNKILRAILITLIPLTSMGALTVNNGGGATNITSTSAWITASVVSTGAANPYLYSYWGTNDGGTNASSWNCTNYYGVTTQAAYSVQATSLSGSTIYYFRTHATNSSESAWSAYSAQFITLTIPTSAPSTSTKGVTVDTNGYLKNPTNFFDTNIIRMAAALVSYGFSTNSANTNAVWGNITGTISDQTDLQAVLNSKASTNTTDALGAATNALNGRVEELESNTGTWNTASTDASAATNAMAQQGLTNVMFSAQIGTNTASVAGIQASTNALQEQATALAGATGALNTAVGEKVPLAGAEMTGLLTNLVGFVGNGAGLTNYSPFEQFSGTITPDAGGTCTIAYAHGSLVQIYQPAMDITLSFDETDYPTTGVSRVGVEIYSLTNSIALDFSTCTNESWATNKSTTGWTTWFFRRVGNDKFKGRQ